MRPTSQNQQLIEHVDLWILGAFRHSRSTPVAMQVSNSAWEPDRRRLWRNGATVNCYETTDSWLYSENQTKCRQQMEGSWVQPQSNEIKRKATKSKEKRISAFYYANMSHHNWNYFIGNFFIFFGQEREADHDLVCCAIIIVVATTAFFVCVLLCLFNFSSTQLDPHTSCHSRWLNEDKGASWCWWGSSDSSENK